MQTKQILALLAANGALAANIHGARHMHQHNKKALVYEATETVTDVSYVTVTVGNNGETVGATTSATVVVPTPATTSSSSSSTVLTTSSVETPSTSSTSSTYVAPATTSSSSATTLVTSTLASSSVASSSAFETPGVNVAESSTSSSTSSTYVAPTTTSSTSTYVASSSAAAATTAASSTSSGNKRGAAYNTASLISPLIGDGTKISWAYNWGSYNDLTDVTSSLEFVPMLWGTASDHTDDWSSNAQAAIDAGSSHLLSFNEPDNSGQANLTPAEAATGHQTYMNPFSSKASIGAPAITNSNIAGESTDWLSEWIDACAGSCDYDFCPAHWYNTIDAGADDLLTFVKSVYDTCGKPVWITEFEPTDGSDSEKSDFLSSVQTSFDSDEYSYVERYSYFMVADGNLVSGGSATTYGSTFAYS